MPVTAALRRELLALSPEERESLAEELYESLVAESRDPTWEAEWSTEIAARISDAEQDPGGLVDAHQMIRELRADFAAKSR